VQLPCNCVFCALCIQRSWDIALKTVPIRGPRCQCATMSFTDVKHCLSPSIISAISDKQAELSTPYPQRTYCHATDCGKFILPVKVADGVATCGSCGGKTCTACKSAHHPGQQCQPDPHSAVANDLAAQYGFRRCHDCQNLVERDGGCWQMTCHCGATFCYLCG
ncbi:hypothetical protein K490DRAFT_20258, partial [Saccharata proteae CBS 121410]